MKKKFFAEEPPMVAPEVEAPINWPRPPDVLIVSTDATDAADVDGVCSPTDCFFFIWHCAKIDV